MTAPATLANVDAAEALTGRYAGVIDAVEAATGEFASTVEDRDLRLGATLYATALEQSTIEADVVRTVLLTSVVAGGGLDRPEEIEAVTTQVADMTRARAVLEESARGPYEEPARRLVAQLDEAGLLPTVRAVLETGQADIAALLGSVDLPAGQGWAGFLDEVEHILVEG